MTRSTARLANDAWEALLTAHSVLLAELESQAVWDGVSMREYDVLYTLSKCDGPIRLSELNRYVLLSQPALSRMVERLISRGLVERAADPADGRGVRLSLTTDGRAEQRRIGGRHAVGVARAVTSRLDRGQIEDLERLCGELAADATQPDKNLSREEAK